jgi:hypothetical protein
MKAIYCSSETSDYSENITRSRTQETDRFAASFKHNQYSPETCKPGFASPKATVKECINRYGILYFVCGDGGGGGWSVFLIFVRGHLR